MSFLQFLFYFILSSIVYNLIQAGTYSLYIKLRHGNIDDIIEPKKEDDLPTSNRGIKVVNMTSELEIEELMEILKGDPGKIKDDDSNLH